MTGLLSSTTRTVGLVLTIGVLAVTGCASGASSPVPSTNIVVDVSPAPEPTTGTAPAPAVEVPPLTPAQQAYMDHQFAADDPAAAETAREYICDPDGTVHEGFDQNTYGDLSFEQTQAYLQNWCAGYDGPG